MMVRKIDIGGYNSGQFDYPIVDDDHLYITTGYRNLLLMVNM